MDYPPYWSFRAGPQPGYGPQYDSPFRHGGQPAVPNFSNAPLNNMKPDRARSAGINGPTKMESNAQGSAALAGADLQGMDKDPDEDITSPLESPRLGSSSKRRRFSLRSTDSWNTDGPTSPNVHGHTQRLEQKVQGLEKRFQLQEEKFEKIYKELQYFNGYLQSLKEHQSMLAQNNPASTEIQPDHPLVLIIPANGTPLRIENATLTDVQTEGDGDAGLSRLPDMRSAWGKESWCSRKVFRMSFVDQSLASWDINDFYYILKSTDEHNLLANAYFADGVWGDVCVMRRGYSTEEGTTIFANVSRNVLLLDFWKKMFEDTIRRG